MALRIIALFFTAAASYYFIEKPCIHAGRNLARRFKSAPALATLKGAEEAA
jgi:peptidoglycan/LPS O-acetylase OafA/YrhL